VLVVEVADSSLAKDRLRKGGLYARAGIADYWIVNLVDGVVEIYRRPERAASRRYGWKFGSVRLLKGNAVVSPLAAPRARIRVADLLP
jgi:Uma2 family endonuclease